MWFGSGCQLYVLCLLAIEQGLLGEEAVFVFVVPVYDCARWDVLCER